MWQVQRYLSLPDLATAQRAVRWNFLLAAVLWLLVGWLGLVMYAVYAECDPITAHQERKTNLQLVAIRHGALYIYINISSVLCSRDQQTCMECQGTWVRFPTE